MDKKTIQLGQDCYWNGNVGQHLVNENNEFVAKVAIQEDYSVKLKLDNKGGIIWGKSNCTCIDGPYCKHVVAVFCAVKGRVTQTSL